MRRFFRRFHKGQKGFTLIELLIVIVILGILAAVVALNVGGFLGTGAKQAAMIEKDTIQTAVLACMSNEGLTQITATSLLGFKQLTPTTTTPIAWTAPVAGSRDLLLGTGTGSATGTQKFLTGSVQGEYSIDADGTVTAAWYPAGAATGEGWGWVSTTGLWTKTKPS